MEEVNNQNNENIESEKSTGTDETNPGGEITLDQFKNALESNLEIKGYYDSIADKTVNKRLEKSIEAWKEKNLETIVNEKINEKYPQKTEAEIEFQNKQLELEKAIQEKEQLQLHIKYQALMAENNIPMEILDFVAGKDVEATISNIERFKTLTESYINDGIDKEVTRRFKQFSYTPPGENGHGSSYGSMWDK